MASDTQSLNPQLRLFWGLHATSTFKKRYLDEEERFCRAASDSTCTYSNLRITELKEILRFLGESVSGNRETLVQRVRSRFHPQSRGPPPPPPSSSSSSSSSTTTTIRLPTPPSATSGTPSIVSRQPIPMQHRSPGHHITYTLPSTSVSYPIPTSKQVSSSSSSTSSSSSSSSSSAAMVARLQLEYDTLMSNKRNQIRDGLARGSPSFLKQQDPLCLPVKILVAEPMPFRRFQSEYRFDTPLEDYQKLRDPKSGLGVSLQVWRAKSESPMSIGESGGAIVRCNGSQPLRLPKTPSFNRRALIRAAPFAANFKIGPFCSSTLTNKVTVDLAGMATKFTGERSSADGPIVIIAMTRMFTLEEIAKDGVAYCLENRLTAPEVNLWQLICDMHPELGLKPKLVEGRAVEKKKVEDEDIEETFQRVSTRCPVSLLPIGLPVRMKSCRHLQPLDFCGLMMLLRNSERWMCPQCDALGGFTSLIVDAKLLSHFRTLPPGCDTVQVNSDGTVEPYHPAPVSKGDRRGRPSFFADLATDGTSTSKSSTPPPPPAASTSSAAENPRDMDEFMDFLQSIFEEEEAEVEGSPILGNVSTSDEHNPGNGSQFQETVFSEMDEIMSSFPLEEVLSSQETASQSRKETNQSTGSGSANSSSSAILGVRIPQQVSSSVTHQTAPRVSSSRTPSTPRTNGHRRLSATSAEDPTSNAPSQKRHRAGNPARPPSTPRPHNNYHHVQSVAAAVRGGSYQGTRDDPIEL